MNQTRDRGCSRWGLEVSVAEMHGFRRKICDAPLNVPRLQPVKDVGELVDNTRQYATIRGDFLLSSDR
jgi:hypothetical protein